jgi:hypothetical protein
MGEAYALQRIRRTPLRDMSIEQNFLLELHKFMTDLRIEANKNRLRSFKNQQHLSYLVGRIHGLIFGLASALIYRGTYFADEIEMAHEAARTEADFLVGEYQQAEGGSHG